MTHILFLLCLALLALLYLVPVWTRRPHKEIVLCALAFFFYFTGTAYAAAPPSTSSTLTWVRATTLIDGTPIPDANHRETLIQWFRAATPNTIIGQVRVPSPATTTVVNGLICGDYSFVAFTVLQNVAVGAEQSAASSPPAIKATGITCVPNPPTGLAAP